MPIDWDEANKRAERVVARLEREFFPQGLTLEDRVRLAVRAEKLEAAPGYVDVLRRLDPEIKLYQAFALWDMARAALYGQALKSGLTPEAAMREAAKRLLATRSNV
jgi:hypothetical protein